MNIQDYAEKHPKLEKGEKILLECMNCKHKQIGYTKIDGFGCEKCGINALEFVKFLEKDDLNV